LLGDFYRPSFSAYDFNFALMSKHALSRIYERYVTLLEFDEDDRQLSFIPQFPTERFSSRSGAIYTPLFVASFFARFLRDNVTPKTFRQMKTIDPACGSGIFLRTLLELQCNPLIPGTTPQTIHAAFQNTYGIDRDANACQATRLSLALLHLVATGTLPQTINVTKANGLHPVWMTPA
jgi:type I restriction-modification system DNA methylase subunit